MSDGTEVVAWVKEASAQAREVARLRRENERLKDRLARVLARAVVVMRSAGNPTWNRRAVQGPPDDSDGPYYRPRGYVWSGKRYSWKSPRRLDAVRRSPPPGRGKGEGR